MGILGRGGRGGRGGLPCSISVIARIFLVLLQDIVTIYGRHTGYCGHR